MPTKAGIEITAQEYVRRMAAFLADDLHERLGEHVTFSILVFDINGPGTVIAAGTAEPKNRADAIRAFLDKHQRIEPNSSAEG